MGQLAASVLTEIEIGVGSQTTIRQISQHPTQTILVLRSEHRVLRRRRDGRLEKCIQDAFMLT